jgi:hypothetical protein
MFNSEGSIGATEYLTLQTECRINRSRYNRVLLYLAESIAKQYKPGKEND